MRRFGLTFGALVLALLALGINGCSGDESGGENKESGAEGEHEDHADHAAHSQDGETDMEKMKDELAKLSPEDAASAEKQHFCPVSGKMLGTMGPPKKIDVNGQDVWICCGGCEEKLLGDPDKYLAKLNEK